MPPEFQENTSNFISVLSERNISKLKPIIAEITTAEKFLFTYVDPKIRLLALSFYTPVKVVKLSLNYPGSAVKAMRAAIVDKAQKDWDEQFF